MSQPSKLLELLLSLCAQVRSNPFVHPRPVTISIPIKNISATSSLPARRTDTCPDNTKSHTIPHRAPSSAEYHHQDLSPCRRRSSHAEVGRAAVDSTCHAAGNIHPEEVRSYHAVGRGKAEGGQRSIRLRLRADRRTRVRVVEGSLEVGSWEGHILPYSVKTWMEEVKVQGCAVVVVMLTRRRSSGRETWPSDAEETEIMAKLMEMRVRKE
jgi:hypothetical protein